MVDHGSMQSLLDIKSIAIVGASEDQSKFGGRLFKNLLTHGFTGDIYPISTSKTKLFEIDAYASLLDLPKAPDAFVLALPGHLVKEQIIRAGEIGAKLGIIISSGFSDKGDDGAALEAEIVDLAHSYGIRLMGPNCLGIISVEKNIVLCSSPVLQRPTLRKKAIGFVSQSGALMTTAFDKAWSNGSGFAHGFSVGNQADLEVSDFIEFMVDDASTKVICAYIEGVQEPKRFLKAIRRAREVGKPVLIVKAGRSEAGQKAAFSHTASIAGDSAVFEAMCREQGALVLHDLGSMISVADYFATQPNRAINRVAIVTPSGGGGALAADALSEYGIELAELSPETFGVLKDFFPANQIKNPLDYGTRVGKDETLNASAVAKAFQQDPNIDLVLCVTAMSPIWWQTDIIKYQNESAKVGARPIVVAIDSGTTANPVRELSSELDIPYTNSTIDAVKTIASVKQWQQLKLSQPHERPTNCPKNDIEFQVKQYSEDETKSILTTYGVSNNEGKVAKSAAEAGAIADELSYPIVLKIVSKDIVHKSDVGGVILNLNNATEVSEAYTNMVENIKAKLPTAEIAGVLVQKMVKGDLELIVGGRLDSTFGPVIIFGAGGILVELLKDKFIAQAPISREAALEGLKSLSIWNMLKGYRGKTLDVDSLLDVIVRLSWMMHDLREFNYEIDLNPVLLGQDHATAVDARLLVS